MTVPSAPRRPQPPLPRRSSPGNRQPELAPALRLLPALALGVVAFLLACLSLLPDQTGRSTLQRATGANEPTLAPVEVAAAEVQPTLGPPAPPTGQDVAEEAGAVFAAVAAKLEEPETSDHYGVEVEELDTGQRFGLGDQRLFESASVYKLGVATVVLRQVDAGQLSLDDTLTILGSDAVEPEPAGGVDVGQTLTLQDALQAMLSVSSNAAAHALLRVLERPRYNAAIQQLGLSHTRVPLEASDQPQILPDWAQGEEDVAVTTPDDTALLLRLLATGQVLSPASRDALYALMRVPGEPRPVQGSLPSDAVVEEKAGNLERASNVAALVTRGDRTFSLAVFDDDVDPGTARSLISQIARAMYTSYLGGDAGDSPDASNAAS